MGFVCVTLWESWCSATLSLLWPGICGRQREAEVSVERAEGSPQSEKTGHAGVFRAQRETHRPQVKLLPFTISQDNHTISLFLLLDVFVFHHKHLHSAVTELRSVKQRLVRQLRDKEEEMDSQNQKLEALRLEVRKAERAKKEVE